MKITLIFIYRDKELTRVKNSLDSLLLQDDRNFNVLLVDYGSNDTYRTEIEQICKAYDFCKYLFIDSQGKFWNRAEALNYGILNCNSDFIFTADIDLVFKTNFVSRLYKEAVIGEAKFFSVGYLAEAQTAELDLEKLDTAAYTKSEDFALGMVLASKETLIKVNGYNVFYAIWGMEDNDLKARLEKLGIKTTFIHDVSILHQYHLPASTLEGGMPSGWIQYSKDYFESNEKVIGLDTLANPPKRSAKEYKTDKEFVTKNINGRILFIRHQLINYIINAPEKKLIMVIDTASHKKPDVSNTARVINFTNATFKILGIHAKVVSNFREQYVSQREIRDEVYFMVKSLNSKILDHYIEESEHSIKLIIVKI